MNDDTDTRYLTQLGTGGRAGCAQDDAVVADGGVLGVADDDVAAEAAGVPAHLLPDLLPPVVYILIIN